MFVISGATGHVGHAVATALLAKGQPVKVIVRDPQKGAEWSKRGAELATGNLDDAQFMTTALKGAQGFFAMLPPNFAAHDVFAWQCKVADAQAAAVKANHVPHVVMLSSVGADLPSGTGPIRGLHYFENVLRATGTKLTAIRAGYFQENVGNLVAAAKGAGIYPNFSSVANVPIPMIATVDIAALAAEQLLGKPSKSEIIDLLGPSYTVEEIAAKLGKALGKSLNVVNIPQDAWVPSLVQAGIPPAHAAVFAEMYNAFNQGIIKPKGDRSVHGKASIDSVITKLAH